MLSSRLRRLMLEDEEAELDWDCDCDEDSRVIPGPSKALIVFIRSEIPRNSSIFLDRRTYIRVQI